MSDKRAAKLPGRFADYGPLAGEFRSNRCRQSMSRQEGRTLDGMHPVLCTNGSLYSLDLESDALLATDCEAPERLKHSELVRRVEANNKEILRLRRWIIEIGQPAEAKVGRLEEELERHKNKLAENNEEMRATKSRLSALDQEIASHEKSSSALQRQIDSLLNDSILHDIERKKQRKKYNEAVQEVAKYKKLTERLNLSNRQLVELKEAQQGALEREKDRFESMAESEQRRFDQFRRATALKMKELTKEIYEVRYKKHSSYRAICGEMLRNAGGHTVEVLVDRVMKR